MSKNINQRKIILIIASIFMMLGIGSTIAYFTSIDSFDNIFKTAKCKVVTQEVFESPSKWKPGDTTSKVVKVRSDCDVCINARVSYEEKWEDKNGNELPLTKENKRVAIVNLENENDWEKIGKYYYYKNDLNKGDETTTFIKSVTFNPEVNIKTTECENIATGRKCTTTSDYSDAKYTLTIKVETIDCATKEGVWGKQGMLMVHDADVTKTFRKEIARNSFESITTVDNMNIPNNAIDSWDVSDQSDGSVMAWYLDEDNNGKYELYLGAEGKIYANTDSSYTFEQFQYVEYMDLSNLDTSKVTTMHAMFNRCNRLATLDVSNFDTSKVTTMRYMFSNCNKLTTVDVSDFDTSQVTDMSYMFRYTGERTTTWGIGDLSNWNTSKVTDMREMFNHAGENSTTWNSIGTLKVYTTNIYAMFMNCPNAKATLNIYGNPTSYVDVFSEAATASGSGITVNYSNATTNIDNIIETKSSNSNVVKGTLLN